LLVEILGVVSHAQERAAVGDERFAEFFQSELAVRIGAVSV
jgi:hypothetical protein